MRTERGPRPALTERRRGGGEHRQPDGRYRARRWEFPGGPQKVRHFAFQRDAERFLYAIQGDLAQGRYVDPAGGRILVQGAPSSGGQWRAVQVHRPRTVDHVETYFAATPTRASGIGPSAPSAAATSRAE